jgi:hypothetical protein
VSDTEHNPETEDVIEDVAEQTTDEDLQAVAPERTDLPNLEPYNVFATYDDPDLASEAVVTLERAGIDGTNISALALDRAEDTTPGDASAQGATMDRDREVVEELRGDVGKGAGIGAVAGALGGTAIALAIPGVGTALGAGILAVAAGGAMAGTGVGGFAGAVSSTPATPGWEQALIDLDHGRVVIGVHSADDEAHAKAVDALSDTGAMSVRSLDANGDAL